LNESTCIRRDLIEEVHFMYAIMQTGGKQYRVQEGDIVYVEKLDLLEGDSIDLDVLLLSGENGIRIGSPLVDGAKINAKVLAHGKGEKIVIYKYKAKKNYRRKQGHRQPFTKLEVVTINS